MVTMVVVIAGQPGVKGHPGATVKGHPGVKVKGHIIAICYLFCLL